FPSRHLEAGSADEDRNLRPMHVDYQLLSHPSPSPQTLENNNLGKAPCRCPQHLSTDAVDNGPTLPGNENPGASVTYVPLRPDFTRIAQSIGESGEDLVARIQDRASHTILLTKVPWMNSLARACLTTSKRNVGLSR